MTSEILKRYQLKISFIFALLILVQTGFAQSHFTFTSQTGNDMTVAIPTSINPTVNGSALVNGDEIGAFTPGGLCVGAVVWDGSNLALTVWGDNDQTGAIDGMTAGHEIFFRVWDASYGEELEATVSYATGGPNYTANAIASLASLVGGYSVPVITSHPANETVSEGQTAQFSVSATGESLSYQWKKNGSNISGATSSSYSIPGTVLGDNGDVFTCVVSNPGGSATSNSATLTVNAVPPVITSHPTDASAIVGQTAQFSVTASGSNLSYQWQKNNSNISNATNSSYTTPSLSLADTSATYRCVVTNTGGSVNSNSAQVTISVEGSGSGTITHDMWAGIPGALLTDLTSNGNYPDNPSSSNEISSLNLADQGDNYGTRIHGFLHPTATGNYRFWVASDDDSELWLSSNDDPAQISKIVEVSGYTNPQQWDKYGSQQSVLIPLTGGQKYYLRALHKEGAGADHIAVAWDGPGIATQTVIDGSFLSPFFDPPAITTQPSNTTVTEGQTAQFSVTATGTNISYQWKKGGVNISNANSANYTTPATVFADNGAQYTCDVSNAAGTVSSNAATLTVNMAVPVITTQPSDATVDVGQTAQFSVVATGTSLSYQWKKGGVNISGATSSSYTTPALALADTSNRYTCVVSNLGGSATSNEAKAVVQLEGCTDPNYLEYDENANVSNASLCVTLISNHSFSVNSGWNMISFNAEPIDTTAESVFNSYSELTVVKDNFGKVYWPPQNVNTLGGVSVGQGYKVAGTANGNVEFQGTMIDVTTPINLASGWNMIAYFPASNLPIETALSNITNDITIVKNNNGDVFWPEFGVNSIGSMKVGEGYALHMKNFKSLVYNTSKKKANVSHTKTYASKRYVVNKITGNNATLLSSNVRINESLAPDGSEIGVFDSQSHLIGSGIIVEGKTAFSFWGDDILTENKDGALSKEKLTLRLWAMGKEYNLLYNQAETLEYQMDSLYFGDLLATGLVGIKGVDKPQILKNSLLNEIHIQFSVPKIAGVFEQNVKIELVNLKGENLKLLGQKKFHSGIQEFHVNHEEIQVKPGMYFIRISSEHFTQFAKVVILQ